MTTTVTTAETPITLTEGGSVLASNPHHVAALARLEQLQAALLARDPLMKGHLLEIHKQLIPHAELVHLLTEEQIGIIMAAQQVHTNTVLVGSASGVAGKKKAAAASAKLTLGDL